MRHELFPADELKPGEVRAVQVDTIGVVVVRTPDDRIRALRDVCPHQGAKLSRGGRLLEFVEADEASGYRLSDDVFVVRCPWHGYEFDVDTGRCPVEPDRTRVRAYDVSVEDGILYLER